MTSIRVIPRYVDHLWYPILVKMAGHHRIVEMQGRSVNEWNDKVRDMLDANKLSPRFYEETEE